MNSFSQYLEISLSHLSPALLSETNKNKMLLLGESLPDLFARFLFGYEKRLIDDGEMDIFVSSCNNHSVYNFNSIFNFPAIFNYTNTDIYWQRIKEFSGKWSDHNNPLNKFLEMTVFEYDLSSLNDEVIIPSVFLGIESKPNYNNSDLLNQLFKRLIVFITGIEILSGKKMDIRVKQLLKDITKRSLGKYYIFQAGLMLSRNDTPIKICLRSFDTKKLMNTINELFPGYTLTPEINLIAQNYCKYFDHLVLALDINSSGIVKTCIECYFDKKRQPPGEFRWLQILGSLCSDGLCDKVIAQEMLSFPGRFTTKNNNLENFPDYYAQGLHHIKFSIGAERNSFAKIYLWSGFHWAEN